MDCLLRILNIVMLVFAGISSLYGLYMGAVGLAGFFKARHLHPAPNGALRRIAVLIPARNEAEVIARPVETLLKQDYPRDMYTVFVLPNNCQDNTEEVARNAGAMIMKPTCPVKCKGDVLQNVLSRLHTEGRFDAYVVFDADNLVDPHFLTEINKALSGGYELAQGFREVVNPESALFSGFGAVYYWMDNYFYTQGRWNLGGSALINGTGFGFTDAYLEKTGGWVTVTMTEDIEYSGRAAIAGERIAWVPTALTYDEQPLTFKESWKQRMRWTVGMYQCEKALNKSLLRAVASSKTSKFALIDMFLFYQFPIVGMMGFGAMLLCLLISALQIPEQGFMQLVWNFVRMIGGSFLSITGLAVVATLRAGKTLKQGRWGILSFWFGMISWALISFVALWKRDLKWQQIKHGQAKIGSKLTNR